MSKKRSRVEKKQEATPMGANPNHLLSLHADNVWIDNSDVWTEMYFMLVMSKKRSRGKNEQEGLCVVIS